MISYKNITILGTSHIAIESVKEVESLIKEKKPDLVALELDHGRFNALFAKKRGIHIRDIRKIGVKGFLFNLAGAFFEKKLGKLVNVAPGSEMKKAVETAKSEGSRIALIDQEISVTLGRLSKRLSTREKLNFFIDIVKGAFTKEKIKFDLSKVPSKDVIKKLTAQVRKRYPSLYYVLVDERNKYMAKNLYRLMHHYNNIVAVVGAGHEEDLVKEIKKWESSVKERSSI